MRCNKARENLSLELDGILPPDSTIDLQKHLDACADCRQYREDLLLGQRLLAATEPQLSENFEWRLQLKLNQTLQAAAGRVDYAWADDSPRWWPWLRNFGAAASVGLAAVLTVAMLTGPGDTPLAPTTSPQPLVAGRLAGPNEAPPTAQLAGESDRSTLALDPTWRTGGARKRGLMQFVSGGTRPLSMPRSNPPSEILGLPGGWSGSNVGDLVTINKLREQNQFLQRRLFATEQQLRELRARLDTTEIRRLDLEADQ